MTGRATLCEHCGEPQIIDLFEVWGFDFLLEFCCEELEQEVRGETELWGLDDWTAFLSSIDTAQAIGVRRAVADDDHVRMHFGLQLAPPPPQKECRAWIKEHHRHNAPPAGWKWAHAVYNGTTLIGVAWVGRPVSRILQEQGWIEVNRCCIDPGIGPHDLVRNACSMLYGAAAREARRRKAKGILTYTRADESGTSVRAAGFEIMPMPGDKEPGIVRGKYWGHSGRPREKHEVIDKVRWARRFRQ